jgi:hypothetical protein
MPQLDAMTFFTQFFWFSLSFTFFYLFLLHYVLPYITLNLKFRKEMLKFMEIDMNKKKESSLNISSSYENILHKALTFFCIFIDKLSFFINSWIVSSIVKVELDFFFKANDRFLKIVIEKDFSFFILNNKLKFNIYNLLKPKPKLSKKKR